MHETPTPLPGLHDTPVGSGYDVACDSCLKTLATPPADRRGDNDETDATGLVYATRTDRGWYFRLVHCRDCRFVFDSCDNDELVARVRFAWDNAEGGHHITDAVLATAYDHDGTRPTLRGDA
jgi:ribosomal protein S27E